MQSRQMRALIFSAAAIGLIAATVPVPAQVFSPGGKSSPAPAPGPAPGGQGSPGGKTFSPSKPGGPGPGSAAPAGPGSGGAVAAGSESLCDDLAARIKALPKAGGRDKSASQAASCAATGQALGIFQAMRIIAEVCNTGGGEMNAALVKMFENFAKLAKDIIDKECQ